MKLMTPFLFPVSLWIRICVLEIVPCERESFLALMSVRNVIRIYTLRLPLKNRDSCCLATSVVGGSLEIVSFKRDNLYAFWVVIELIDHELS